MRSKEPWGPECRSQQSGAGMQEFLLHEMRTVYTIQADLGHIPGLVPNHLNKPVISIKQVTQMFFVFWCI